MKKSGWIIAGILTLALVFAAFPADASQAIHQTLRDLTLSSSDIVLGRVEGLPGHHPLDLFPSAQTYPGLALFRFNAPLVFFNGVAPVPKMSMR